MACVPNSMNSSWFNRGLTPLIWETVNQRNWSDWRNRFDPPSSKCHFWKVSEKLHLDWHRCLGVDHLYENYLYSFLYRNTCSIMDRTDWTRYVTYIWLESHKYTFNLWQKSSLCFKFIFFHQRSSSKFLSPVPSLCKEWERLCSGQFGCFNSGICVGS